MVSYKQARLSLNYLIDQESSPCQDDGQDVISGLTQTQKSLPPRYFYNHLGSQLFEKICTLPEYYPTRTEAAILKKYATEIAQVTESCELIELGSGSSTKTRLLLDAYQEQSYPLVYLPVDVSKTIVEFSAQKLLDKYPRLQIQGFVSTYEQALEKLTNTDYLLSSRMVIFLGSTLGNFNQSECDRFFSQINSALNQYDYFLLGVDLQKSSEILTAAYNDSQGVTAAFNLNMLAHLNQRFQGNFDLNLFKHKAIYNEERSQIEMYLISQTQQTVNLAALDLTVEFSPQETILTEISRKFNLQKLESYLTQQQLKLLKTYTDDNHWFSLLLCQKFS